jgi:TorA maturation chaperone TorD
MSAGDLLPLFTQAGALSVFAWVLSRFFRSAVEAHKAAAMAHSRRADDWKAAYDAEVKRSNERDAQLAHVLSAINRGTQQAGPG